MLFTRSGLQRYFKGHAFYALKNDMPDMDTRLTTEISELVRDTYTPGPSLLSFFQHSTFDIPLHLPTWRHEHLWQATTFSAIWGHAITPMIDIVWFSWRLHGMIGHSGMKYLYVYIVVVWYVCAWVRVSLRTGLCGGLVCVLVCNRTLCF